MGACCQPPKPAVPPKGPACCAAPTEAGDGLVRWWPFFLCGTLGAVSMVLAMGLAHGGPGAPAAFSPAYWRVHGCLLGSSVLSFALLGRPLLRAAVASWREGRLTLESLFLLSMLGALGFSAGSTFAGSGDLYYDVIPVVLAIYWLGNLLGRRNRLRADAALAELRVALDTVRVVVAGAAPERRPRSALRSGDRILVLAGETLPVDGRVVAGSATVVEAAVTGEPFPVPKSPGSDVHAGSVVADAGHLEVAPELTRPSRLDAVLGAVDRALAAPSAIQREADRLLGWFLPLVVAAGLLAWFGWALAGQPAEGLRALLAVYLVACPCALGLATPIAVMGALHRLGRLGFAPRSGDLILQLAEVDAVVFDKTGTLGEGRPDVAALRLAPGCPLDESRLRAVVAAVESRAEHPLAATLARLAPPATLGDLEVRAVPGQGVVGKWSGGELRVGEPALMPSAADFAFADDLPGKRVRIALDGRAAAVVVLRETLRPDALSAIAALRQLGLEVEVLTGDPSPAWSSLAGAAVRAGMSPADKAERVRALSAEGRKVLFVGDGLNDLQGMSLAHATVALAGGADLTRASCDAVLAVDRLLALPEAVALARRVRADLRVNLLLSVAYNLVGIALAAAGLLSPMSAALVMLVSSVLVALRALRSVRPPPAEA